MTDGNNERNAGHVDVELPDLPRVSSSVAQIISDGRGGTVIVLDLGAIACGVTDDVRSQVDVDDNSDSSIRDHSVLEDGSVTALSRLYVNYNWSNGLVHGPDMIFAFHELVETLLEGGETVVAIDSMQFRQPVTANLQLYAKVGDENILPSGYSDGQKPAVIAEFVTSNGRKIKLQGFKTTNSIDQFAEAGVSLFRYLGKDFDTWELSSDSDGREIRIFDMEPLKGKPKLGEGISPSGMNVAMDLVLYAASKLGKARRSVIPKADFAVAASLKFDVIPSGVDLCGGGCKLELDVGKIKENGGEFRFIPIEFVFKKTGNLIGKGVFTIAQPVSTEVADKYCDRL